jgi:hypothetical protein
LETSGSRKAQIRQQSKAFRLGQDGLEITGVAAQIEGPKCLDLDHLINPQAV